MARLRKELTNHRFGRLVVQWPSGIRQGATIWLCLCDCGGLKNTSQGSLSTGRAQSCGCRQKELAADKKRIHGGFSTAEWLIWRAMKSRCRNPNIKGAKYYSGCGIKVCERWQGKEGFANFLADMGSRPSLKHSIDRFPDNNGNYEPGNCRWATSSQQSRNRRKWRRGCIPQPL